jgi:methyltransferase (TIGR00027 family)
MDEGRPSATSTIAAMMRAAHLLWDDDPKILHDPLALGLSGVAGEAALRATLEAFQAEQARRSTPEFAQALLRDMRALLVMRQRYTEDELGKALEQGVAQYVILGAGLDSFAYRRPDLGGVLRVFEVDHPATQQWKRARLRALHIDLPSHLTLIPLDFEQRTLADGLSAGGHRPERPTFVSWLGVTMYLTEEAVFDTLRYVASWAPGSEIVFHYSLPASWLDDEGRRLSAARQAAAAARGEPWLSLFDPTMLATHVQALGFSQVWDLGPEEANDRYFAGRADGLRAPLTEHLMKARVGHVVSSAASTKLITSLDQPHTASHESTGPDSGG